MAGSAVSGAGLLRVARTLLAATVLVRAGFLAASTFAALHGLGLRTRLSTGEARVLVSAVQGLRADRG